MEVIDVCSSTVNEGPSQQRQDGGAVASGRSSTSSGAPTMKPSSNQGSDHSIQGSSPGDTDGTGATSFQQRLQQQKLSPCKAAFALALSSTIMFGLYYLIAMPASVRKHIQEVMPPEDENFEVKFQLLYTLIGLPGIVLPLFAGAVVDKVGARYCLLILSFTCFIGQVTSAVGVQNESWPITLFGRLVYGLGFESLFVSNQAFLTICFEGERLGMALGVSGAASYAGLLLSPILSPIVANEVSTAFSFWVGVIIIGVSVLAALVIFVSIRGPNDDATNSRSPIRRRVGSAARATSASLDDLSCRHTAARTQTEALGKDDARDRHQSREEHTGEDVRSYQQEALVDERRGAVNSMRFICSGVSSFGLSFWLISTSCLLNYSTTGSFSHSASGILLERNLFVEPPEDCALQYPNQCSSGYIAPTSGNPSTDPNGKTCPVGDEYAPVIPSSLNITPGDTSWDKQSYVYSSLGATDVDCTDNFWSEACTYRYCEREEAQTEKAGVLMSITSIVAVFTTFPFGYFGVDRSGLRAEMVTLAPVLLTVSHALLAYLRNSPIMPLVLMGLGHSIAVSAIWPSVPMVVPQGFAGMAFGLMTCIQNVGLTLFPLVVAAIYNAANHQYVPAVEVFYMWCSVLAVLIGVALTYWDRKNGGKLRVRGAS